MFKLTQSNVREIMMSMINTRIKNDVQFNSLQFFGKNEILSNIFGTENLCKEIQLPNNDVKKQFDWNSFSIKANNKKMVVEKPQTLNCEYSWNCDYSPYLPLFEKLKDCDVGPNYENDNIDWDKNTYKTLRMCDF